MESTREERMQQRLRGAQRQVKDVDFGFMFPAFQPPPAAPTAQDSLSEASANPATPQPELPTQLSHPTPTTASKSRGRPSNVLGLQSNNVARSNTGNDANTSAKRRKLDTDEPPSSSTRSMRSSRSSARQDIYAIPDDDEPEKPTMEISNLSLAQSVETNAVAEPESPMAVPPVAEVSSEPIETELDASNAFDATNGDRIEVENEEDSLQEEITITTLKETEALETPSRPSRNKRKRDSPGSEVSAPDQSIGNEADSMNTTNTSPEEALPKQLRRSRRKSSPQEVENNEESNVEDSLEQAEAIDDYEAASRLKRNRGRRVSRNAISSDSQATEDAAPPRSPVAKKKRGRARHNVSPVQQRQPASSKTKTQKADKKSRKVREGSPIPVTVHRLTAGPVYDGDASDADILNAEIPCAKRAGVNAVDVLSQICQELVTGGLETLGDKANKTQDAALRLEYKTQIRAVESFSKELQVRLLEHAINLDNAYSLEKRLREGLKKKLSLREEILRVRAEREKVALRMDEIRITHEKDSNDAQQRESLNTTVHDIELALERGKSSFDDTNDGKTNIELMLKRVANEASSTSDSGGILKQIKAFNAFMERAALALEGREAV